VVVRSRAKRAREKDISLNARKENSKRLRQGHLEHESGGGTGALTTGGAASTEIGLFVSNYYTDYFWVYDNYIKSGTDSANDVL
jgi:hypothetical protein